MYKTQITSYLYGFHTTSVQEQYKSLQLFNNDDRICFIYFTEEKLSGYPIVISDNFVVLNLNISWLADIIDMLRNEKPVYFIRNNDRGIFSISTEEEPVGEEEFRR